MTINVKIVQKLGLKIMVAGFFCDFLFLFFPKSNQIPFSTENDSKYRNITKTKIENNGTSSSSFSQMTVLWFNSN